MSIQPYLFFEGRCEEAIDFYRRAVGAEVQMLMRNKDNPEPAAPGTLPPGSENKIMHASLRIGDATILVSDSHCAGETRFNGFGLALQAPDIATADRWFKGLADGGTVRMPQSKTFFSPRFGMVADRFGVLWMVIVAQ